MGVVHVKDRYSAACVLFSVALVVADMIAPRLVAIGPLIFTSGMVAFPITFVLTDLVHERYGTAAARAMTLMGLAASSVAYVLVALAMSLPAAPVGVPADVAHAVFGSSLRVILASLCAFAASQASDLVIFRTLSNVSFLSRATVSTVASQGVDTLVFTVAAFAWSVPWPVVVSIAGGLYAVKVAASVAAIPVLAIARQVTK